MKTFKYGDTLEGAAIGDQIINYFGEVLTITGERGSVWITYSERGLYPRPVFKYNPDRVVIWGV